MFKTFVLLTCAVLIVAGAAGAATRGDEPFQEGMKSYDEGDWDAAIDSFEKAVESDESSSLYHTWLGRAYIAKLQTVSFFEKGVLSGRALEHLQKAVELDPANVDARVSLAGYYLNAPSIAGGSKKKARQQAEAIATYDEVTGNWIMARVLVEDEKYDEAIEAIEACVAARPENVDYRYQLAMVYQQQERYDEAFAEFENIVRIDPDAAGALYQIGRTAVFSAAKADRGIECLQKYLTLQPPAGYPGYDAAHWRLGMLYEQKGDFEAARIEYETALRLNPDDDKYRDSLKELARD